jgi:hypothetical protein
MAKTLENQRSRRCLSQFFTASDRGAAAKEFVNKELASWLARVRTSVGLAGGIDDLQQGQTLTAFSAGFEPPFLRCAIFPSGFFRRDTIGRFDSFLQNQFVVSRHLQTIDLTAVNDPHFPASLQQFFAAHRRDSRQPILGAGLRSDSVGTAEPVIAASPPRTPREPKRRSPRPVGVTRFPRNRPAKQMKLRFTINNTGRNFVPAASLVKPRSKKMDSPPRDRCISNAHRGLRKGNFSASPADSGMAIINMVPR